MNFVTHIQMADVLYGELDKIADLDRESFIYGNIKPDCTPDSILTPHTLTNYFDRVLNLAENLIKEDMTREVFSESLGVLCHFLSDFFCLYHAKEDKFNRYFSHVIYEIRLHNYHKKRGFQLLTNIFSFKSDPVRNLSRTILSYREEYFSRPHSFESDFFYAYRLCKSACQSIAYYRSGRVICNQTLYNEQPAYIKVGGMR